MEWVYEVVLPAIREKGWYANANTIDPAILKNRLSIIEQKRKHILAIRDAPNGLRETLIEDVVELCFLLEQKKPDIKEMQQTELPLRFIEQI